jgi:hypothetical protein
MIIKPQKNFETVSQRILYGLNLIYSVFTPVESNDADARDQENLHTLMGSIIEKLYWNPELLGLTLHKDEAFEAYELNNMKPELDKIYGSIYKELYEFYKFLYIAALHGDIRADCMKTGGDALKANKSAYRPRYKTLLNEIGMGVGNDKTGVSITAGSGVLRALKLLAEKTPANVNKWTPFSIVNFAACSFANGFEYIIQRTETVCGLDGMLLNLRKQCLEKGYARSVECFMTATDISYNILFKNSIGGFIIDYRSRKYRQFGFGTLNGIGEKAMLDDFDNLDKDLQEHFIRICRTCNRCLICTKGGKNKIFTVEVSHGGKTRSLCPSFPQHSWDAYEPGLIETLHKYHAAQEKYGADWKNDNITGKKRTG